VAGLLHDLNPLVRAAAVPIQRAASLKVRVQRIESLLQDKRQSVRIVAVRSVLDILAARVRPGLSRSARLAVGEYQRSLAAKADFPESQMAIAGTALVFRNYRAAERAFTEAVRMDPQRVDAWIMIARLRAAQGNREGATNTLLQAIKANPNNADLEKLMIELRNSNRKN
jgi:tetratricopeptide (TPR) repeat protein